MSKQLIKTTRPRRYFYAANVNMGLSFDSLEAIARKMYGAELEVGDILICDNSARDKRKMLQMTKDGFMIYYGRLNKGSEFKALANKDGQLKSIEQEVL